MGNPTQTVCAKMRLSSMATVSGGCFGAAHSGMTTDCMNAKRAKPKIAPPRNGLSTQYHQSAAQKEICGCRAHGYE
jgi:hypothetical protein